MADPSAPKKGFLRWIWEDVIVAFAVAVGLDVVVKTQWPKLLSEFSMMLSSIVKRKVDNDKRADLLREFRRMEGAGMNIKNLRHRYICSIRNRPIPEYLFVELLCKLCPTDPDDPLKITRPVAPESAGVPQPAAPGTAGAPQNDRQADLLWLNNMNVKDFYAMLYFLHHNVIGQWWQIGRDWVLGKLGPIGTSIAGAADFLSASVVRFFQWISRSLWRMAFVALLAAILFWPLALIVTTILAWFHGRRVAYQNGTQRKHMFRFIATMIGVALMTLIYFELVPTSVDRGLAHAVILAFVAMSLLNTRWRTSLLCFIAVCAVIFFYGGRTAAKNELKNEWAWVVAKHDAGKPTPAPATPATASNQTPPTGTPDAKAQELADAGTDSQTKTPPASTPPPAYIFPQGDHGIIEPAAVSCVPTDGDEKRCWGLLFNNDSIAHGVFLMDSIVSIYYGGENRQFNSQFPIMTMGGGLKFAGTGGDFATLTPDAGKSPDAQGTNFTFSFREPRGGVKSVDIVLKYETVADSIHHTVVITGIPVIQNQL